MTYATKERLVTGAMIALIAGELMFLAAHPAHADAEQEAVAEGVPAALCTP